MELQEIADAIERTKADFFAEIVKDAETAKAEAKRVANDSTRSTDWINAQIDVLMEKYNVARMAKAEKVAAELEALYGDGINRAAEVFAKQPTPGELAYLQAFNMKERITKSDVDSALLSLGSSVVASAAVCERAEACGVKCGKAVPGYIAVSGVHGECLEADKGLVVAYGRASRTGSGSDMAFSSDSLQMSMRAKYVANEFTNALRAVSEFE